MSPDFKDENTVNIQWDEVMECKENDCQMVINLLSEKMQHLLPGMVLRLKTIVPETIAEIPMWIEATAHELLEKAQLIREDGSAEFFYYIRKR